MARFLGIEFAPLNIPLSRRLQTAAVLFWISSYLFMGPAALFILVYLLYTQYWWITLCYFGWYLWSQAFCRQGGRRSKWQRQWSLWRYFRDYFPMKVVKTAELDPSKNYIMGYHPHGILCAGAVGTFASEALGFSKLFPGLTPYLLALEGNFSLPIYREYLLNGGLVSSSKDSMNYLLSQEEKGQALCLVLGGAQEALDAHPGSTLLHCRKRMGFSKMALKHGASLVPIYSFGETDIYDQVDNPKGSRLRRFQDRLQKIIGLAPCLLRGRGIFQYNFGIVPKRRSITVVVGKPLDVPQVENPSNEEVESLQNRYLEALTKLYDDHKQMYSSHPDKHLDII